MPNTGRAYDVVLVWLEDQLRSGEITVGNKLPGERALAEQFGISRTSVREAIRILDAMGLVRSGTGSGPNAGAVVISEPSAALSWALRMHVATNALPLNDLVHTRVLIESEAAADAAVRECPEREQLLAEAKALLDSMDNTEMPSEEFNLNDASFHITITKLAGNLVTDTIMNSLRQATVEYVREAIAQRDDWRDLAPVLQEQHREILTGITERDPQRAREAVKHHIMWFYELTSVPA